MVNYATTAATVQSDPVTLCNVDFQAIDNPTQYQPGTYTFPFQLLLPGDLATTDSAKLQGGGINWRYEIQSCGVPTSMFVRRKFVQEEITLKRVHVVPSDNAEARFTGKREGLFECSFFAPKYISTEDRRVGVRVFLHPFTEQHRVKEIVATAIQIEDVSFHSEEARNSLYFLRRT